MSSREETLEGFLEALAAKTSSPGGGAAAALLAAVGAALAAMVVNYSKGSKGLTQHEPVLQESLKLLEVNRQAAMILAQEDAIAYARLGDLQKLDQADPRRRKEWSGAVDRAIQVPLRVLELAIDLLQLCEQLVGRSNERLRSDLAIAAIAGEAAAASAAWNVRANLPLCEPTQGERVKDDLNSRLNDAHALRKKIESACE